MSDKTDQAELVTPELTEEEEHQAQERRSVSPLVVHEAIRKLGDEELDRPPQALAWSGLAAGLSMGTSLIVQGLLRAHLPDAPWRPLVQQLGYPFGFLMIVIGRQQLFTENTVTAIVPLLTRRTWETFLKVVKLWLIVLGANLVGAHLTAWVLSNTALFQPEIQHAFDEIAREAFQVGFGAALLKGIAAGWLIAMMVWMLSGVRSGEIAVIVLMTYVVGLGALTHIVAGSIEVLFLVFNGTISWWAFAYGYGLPTLLGNIIGGVSLVAALNHAQVVAGHPEAKTPPK